jgi:hypothetical protein
MRCIIRRSLVRTNALEALGARSDEQDELTEELVQAASDPENDAIVMGTIRVSHVAVAALVRRGTARAVAAARRFIQRWLEPDRGDLLWYLRAESLMADDVVGSDSRPIDGATWATTPHPPAP